MMKKSLKKTYDDFWPVPQRGDELLPDTPEPEMNYPQIGATVIAGHHRGKVLDIEERYNDIVVIVEIRDPDGWRYVGAWALRNVRCCDVE